MDETSEQVAASQHTEATKEGRGPLEGEIKSRRIKRPRKLFSPDDIEEEARSRRKQKKPKRFPFSSSAPNRPHDILPNGEPFSCDLCKSKYVVNPKMKKTLKNRRSKNTPAPKQMFDVGSGKNLTLCNGCALAMTKNYRPRIERPGPSLEEKELYIQDAAKWAKDMADKFDLPNAVHLFCPVYKRTRCGCLQNYIEDSSNAVEKQKRVSQLSAMAAEARRLSALKCYDRHAADHNSEAVNEESNENTEDSTINTSQKSRPKKKGKVSVIGLGNGHKKSEKFAAFVLSKREYLKKQLNICERAVQKILYYSNNFLHKRLKTEEKRCRVVPVKGKARLGLLQSFNDIAKKRCCVDNCVMMALTHRSLLEEWRKRAQEGQTEARKVISEMLTPSANARKNCYTFVTSVTGCSRTTVVQVNQQMLYNGGSTEPPVHGLKMLHANKKVKEPSHNPDDLDPKKLQGKEIGSSIQSSQGGMGTTVNNTSGTVFITTTNESSANSQKSKLQILQQQLSQQQEQLQQQQQLQQQLLQQTLSSSSQSENISLLQHVNNELNIQIQNTQRGLQQTLHSMGLIVSSNSAAPTVSRVGDASMPFISNPPATPSQTESTVYEVNFPVSSANVLNSTDFPCGPQVVYNSANFPMQITQQGQPQIIQLTNQVYSSQQHSSSQQMPGCQVVASQQMPGCQVVASQQMPGSQVVGSQQMPGCQVVVSQQMPGSQVVGSQQMPGCQVVASQQMSGCQVIVSQPLIRTQNFQTPQQIIFPQQSNYVNTSSLQNQNIIQLPSSVSMATPKVVAVGKEGDNVVYTVTIPNSISEPQVVQLPQMIENRKVTAQEITTQRTHTNSFPTNMNSRMVDALSRMEVVEMNLMLPNSTSPASGNSQYPASTHASVEKAIMESVTLSKIVQGNLKQKRKQKLTEKQQFTSQNTPNPQNPQNTSLVGKTVPQNMVVNPSSCVPTVVSPENLYVNVHNSEGFGGNIQTGNKYVHSTMNTRQPQEGQNKDIPASQQTSKTSNYSEKSGLQVDSSLTAEHMNFSLPLSDVITMYSSQGAKTTSSDNGQHIQLSLQINQVPGASGDAVHVNTVDLGSIVIMDKDDNAPPTVSQDVLENVTNRQRSRQESLSTEQQLVIDEDTMSLSGDGHVTDTDEEVQDILQSGDKSIRPQTLTKKSGTLPFLPQVERKDTVILHNVDAGHVDASHGIERSDTIKLPEEKEPSISISLPIKKQKAKKKGNVNKHTQPIDTVSAGGEGAGNKVIIGGNMPSVDQAWLHELMIENAKK